MFLIIKKIYLSLYRTHVKYIYDCHTGDTYTDLAELLEGKDYYIVTTNQDAQFYRVFPANRITRIQGDWRYWQCSQPCHDNIYDNHTEVMWLCDAIQQDALPDKLIPRCPHCGRPMAPWVRSREFLQGTFYHREMKRYMNFLQRNANRKTLFLELGVGMMTRGEVALIVAQKGLAVNVVEPVYFTAVILLIVVSSVATPLVLKNLFTKMPPQPHPSQLKS